MNLPLLSIIIPTKNRDTYAQASISSVLKINDPRLQLVVQDNSDSPKLLDWIKNSISDERLKYNYTAKPLSFVDNWNEAISLADGYYVCAIGDDDGINPEIVEAAQYLYDSSVRCLSIKTVTNYVWPNSGIPSTIFTKKTDSNLTILKFDGSVVEIDSERELVRFIKGNGIYYLDYKLPKLYYGIVSRSALDLIHAKTGRYISGLTPDIFVSVALACVTSKILVTDYPLVLPGVCRVSASILEGALKCNPKNIQAAPHLKHRGAYHWSDKVPKIYTVESIWADSCISALSSMGRTDLLERLNVAKIYAICGASNTGVTKVVISDFIKYLEGADISIRIGFARFTLEFAVAKIRITVNLIKRIWKRVFMRFHSNETHRIHEVHDIHAAVIALVAFLKANNKRFKLQKRT